MINRITIVIAYYRLKYFGELLLSLANQTNKKFDVFIGNDASPDDPIPLITKYKDLLNINYKYFDLNFGGEDLVNQWKRCISYVDTEWFMILGDDDQLSEEVIAGFYETIENFNCASVLRLDIQIIDGNGAIKTKVLSYKEITDSCEFIYLRAQYKVRSSLGEYFFKIADFKNFGIQSYPKAFYSDNKMVLDYARMGSITAVKKGYAKIRVSEDSITGSKENQNYLVEAGYLFYTDLLQNHPKKFTRKQKDIFLDYFLSGYLTRVSIIKSSLFWKIIFQNASLKKCVHIIIRFAKYRLSNRRLNKIG